jgi:hypothetical protein
VPASRWLALSRPPFVLAVALLATNDAVLKHVFPGWWTGKLSDLAGVFIVGVVLGLASRRPWTADLLTAAGFAALKLSPYVAGLAAPLLGGVTRTDATDLVALVALVPAHLFVRRHVVARSDGQPWQVPLTAAAVALTVLSVSATSCGSDDTGIQQLEVLGDGSVVATAGRPDGYGDAIVGQYRSTDGGATWQDLYVEPGDEPLEGEVISEDEACIEDGPCYRVSQTAGGPVGAVEVERDGGWAVASTLSAEQVRRIDLRRGYTSCGDELGEDEDDVFGSVAVVDGPDGQHVLVTMGTEGLLHLGPDATEWERIGVDRYVPTSTSGPSWLDRLGWAPVLVTVVLVVGLLVWMLVRRERLANAGVALLVAVVGGGALILAALLATGFFDTDYAVRGPTLAVLSVLLAVLCIAIAVRRPRPVPEPPPPEAF